MTNCSAKGKKETRKRKEGNILWEWKGSDLCFCRWIMKQHQREEKKEYIGNQRLITMTGTVLVVFVLLLN